MNDIQNLSPIIGFVSILLINKINSVVFNSKEYFGSLPPMTTKLNREILTNGNSYSVSGNYQSTLAPRFINTNIGANIRYHLPSESHMASPTTPTTVSYNQKISNRPSIIDPPSHKKLGSISSPLSNTSNCSQSRQDNEYRNQEGVNIPKISKPCGSGMFKDKFYVPHEVAPRQSVVSPQDFKYKSNNVSQESNHSYGNMVNQRQNMGAITQDENSHQVLRMRNLQKDYVDVADLLPVDDLNVVTTTLQRQGNDVIQHLETEQQPIIYDRFMFANAKSKLRGAADPIRGDLPIVPILPQATPDSGVWFRPSVTPHIDLGRGFMAVAGGFDNDTNSKLRNLMEASSGGTLQTFGGSNVPLQRSIINDSSGDLVVTSFV
jgi:hypothetical protein